MDRFTELRDKILPVLLPYARRIAVFGSFVRGDDTPESDIDLLVTWKKAPPPPWGTYGLADDLERILQRPVDLIEDRLLNAHVRPYVERELLPLYEEGKPLPQFDVEALLSHKGKFKKDPMVYLQHILDAIERITVHLRGVRNAIDFFDNVTVQDAVVRQVEIIGEAARKIPTEFRNAHPEIDWRQIVGMRHRIVHDYTNVDLSIVWRVAQEDLPVMRAQIEAILREE